MVKRDEVKNLINQDRRDNEVEQHKNIGLQELETIHANPTRKSDAPKSYKLNLFHKQS